MSQSNRALIVTLLGLFTRGKVTRTLPEGLSIAEFDAMERTNPLNALAYLCRAPEGERKGLVVVERSALHTVYAFHADCTYPTDIRYTYGEYTGLSRTALLRELRVLATLPPARSRAPKGPKVTKVTKRAKRAK